MGPFEDWPNATERERENSTPVAVGAGTKNLTIKQRKSFERRRVLRRWRAAQGRGCNELACQLSFLLRTLLLLTITTPLMRQELLLPL